MERLLYKERIQNKENKLNNFFNGSYMLTIWWWW